MFSPVKAITAGALIFAVGGAFLIAQPFGQQATVPAAVTDPELMAPAAVTGTVSPVTEESPGSPTLIDGFGMQSDGVVYSNTWESDDPRLSGVSTIRGVLNRYSEQRMQVGAAQYTLENDGGRWVGLGTVLEGERLGEAETVILRGEDAYSGLTAYVVIERESATGGPFRAAIFPGEMPPFPEAPAAQ